LQKINGILKTGQVKKEAVSGSFTIYPEAAPNNVNIFVSGLTVNALFTVNKIMHPS
jgi:hypothetical protein